MSEFDLLKIPVPGVTKPGRFGIVKDPVQEYILTATLSKRPVVVPVVRARVLMTEDQVRADPKGAGKWVQVGPDMTLDLESKNNPANITALLDFLEHNAVYIYSGELADYNVLDRTTYETADRFPVVKLEHARRRYLVFKDGRPFRSTDELGPEDPTPKSLHFEPLNKKWFIDGLGDEWEDIDNQLAENYRARGKADKLTYYKPPKISADLREEAVLTFGNLNPDRFLSGRDVLLEQFPEWGTLSEEDKARDPFDDLVRLLNPVNMYDGITDAEYIRACKLCIKGVLVGSANRQYHPARVDVFPILIGEQGAGKTTFCNFLGSDISDLDAFIRSMNERAPFKGEIERSASDESGNRHADNKIWERSNTKLITEFLEGNALRRSTINTFKMIADKTTATFARLYEDEHEEALTSVYWVTTNDPRPLFDTDNRRFFPVWMGGDQLNPSPIASVVKDRQAEDYRERMAILWNVLRISRAHARHLAEEGHSPQEYFNEEFTTAQRTINGQSVTADPLEEKIGNMFREKAPEIIRENSVIVIDRTSYAPIGAVESALKVALSEYIPAYYRPEVGRAFKNAWANRQRYGIYKDPKGGGYPRNIDGKTVRTVHLIDKDGSPRADYLRRFRRPLQSSPVG